MSGLSILMRNNSCFERLAISDLEDGMQYYTALENGAEVVIMRNAEDFRVAGLPVMSAEEYSAIGSR
jgi:hypothetical protein